MSKHTGKAGCFPNYGLTPAIYHDTPNYQKHPCLYYSSPDRLANSNKSGEHPELILKHDDTAANAASNNTPDTTWGVARSNCHQLQSASAPSPFISSPQFSASTMSDVPEYPVYPFLSNEMGFSRYLVVSALAANIEVDDLRRELVLESFVMSYVGEQGHVFAIKYVDGGNDDQFSAVIEFCDTSSVWTLSKGLGALQIQGIEFTIAMETPPAGLSLHPLLRQFPLEVSSSIKMAESLLVRKPPVVVESPRYVSDEVVQSHLDRVTRAFKPREVVKSYHHNHNSATHSRGHRNLSNFVDLDRIHCGQDVRTTIMLRNIPNKVDQAWLKRFLDETSWGRFDFMYLRIDFANDCNVGYAFINFCDLNKPMDVVHFVSKRGNQRWNCFKSDKVAEVSYAALQGRDALVAKFRNSVVMLEAPHYRPKLFYTGESAPGCIVGEEEAFPEPDNDIKMRRSCANAEQGRLFTSNSNHKYNPRGGRTKRLHHDSATKDDEKSQLDRGIYYLGSGQQH
ncbi:uncharacterized protein BROUX77_004837 [Berkeleyomyces rouxiae]|uniref:uncharacterized protein n=1 Tax=Berkeleyomyces rouxiae TaxID=2035830 RepID=UPI003B803031